jgi:hypothetical protein
MLDQIFKDLRNINKSNSKKTIITNQNQVQNQNLNQNLYSKSINLKTEKKPDPELEYLEQLNNLSENKNADDILKKYCTLYDDEDMEINSKFSSKKIAEKKNNFGEFAIKPMNFEYQQKKIRREENLNTTGKDWFNMKAPEITPELKEDLKALQLKNIIDPSRFYKKSDSKKLPKFFQVGRIMENIIEGKKYRLKKHEVKNRIAEEILESDLAKNYSLRKFEELQGKRRKLGARKAKINKYKLKNKKFSGKKDFVQK